MKGHIHRYDAIVVGGGGAGLSCALEMSTRCRVAVVSKLYPTRSHTGAAQGGVAAALGNMEEDNWEWHVYDTIKGSDFLGDQDAIEVMCREAIDTIVGLEHLGLPFDRTPEGKIAQRRFGGHSREHGKAPVMRACHSADRTGHMILQTLYQHCIKNDVHFYDEYLVMDYLQEKGACAGIVALSILDGEVHTFHAPVVVFCTGGFGRMWRVTSNALSLTGDGGAILLRRGIPLEDMEFFQFHPTGLYKLGVLITEGVRGDGGILKNDKGERFMERYAPTMKDLASRDVISRAIYTEIKEGRGIGGKSYVNLDATNIPKHLLETKLSEVFDLCETYLGIDVSVSAIPVEPTAHYAMGGIPTDVDGRVVIDDWKTIVPGLYAVGECACVSVHGANRLGTNSLLDIIVFGQRAARKALAFLKENCVPDLPPGADEWVHAECDSLRTRSGAGEKRESMHLIRKELAKGMMDDCSVFRTGEKLRSLQRKLKELKERYRKAGITDKGKTFNEDLVEGFELGCLLDQAEATVICAANREESRGGHFRNDFPKRDDVNWLKHTLIHYDPAKDEWRIAYKPVVITKYKPEERKY